MRISYARLGWARFLIIFIIWGMGKFQQLDPFYIFDRFCISVFQKILLGRQKLFVSITQQKNISLILCHHQCGTFIQIN